MVQSSTLLTHTFRWNIISCQCKLKIFINKSCSKINCHCFYTRTPKVLGHLIAATVMTLDVCQGHSSIANFFLYWPACRVSLCHSRASCHSEQRLPLLQKNTTIHALKSDVSINGPLWNSLVKFSALIQMNLFNVICIQCSISCFRLKFW